MKYYLRNENVLARPHLEGHARMAHDVITDGLVIRIEVSEPQTQYGQGYARVYTLPALAQDFTSIEHCLTIAAWITQTRTMASFDEYLTQYKFVNSQPNEFRVSALSYNSPFWIDILAASTSAIGVGYAFVNLWDRINELRRNESDAKVIKVINDEIMDELEFAHQEKISIRAAVSRPSFLVGLPVDAGSETKALYEVAELLVKASTMFERVSQVEVKDAK
jgi:hypothetical protein